MYSVCSGCSGFVLWCTEYDATMAWHASLYSTHEWHTPHTAPYMSIAGMKPKFNYLHNNDMLTYMYSLVVMKGSA